MLIDLETVMRPESMVEGEGAIRLPFNYIFHDDGCFGLHKRGRDLGLSVKQQ